MKKVAVLKNAHTKKEQQEIGDRWANSNNERMTIGDTLEHARQRLASQSTGGGKYRKKPVVIDAFEWRGDIDSFKLGQWHAEMGIGSEGKFVVNNDSTVSIHTLENVMTASPGDFIIRGVNGEFYPCKPDIFKKTYEPAE
ncbi:hypothetical protein GCM10028805_22530 [Spirosoma harenae]